MEDSDTEVEPSVQTRSGRRYSTAQSQTRAGRQVSCNVFFLIGSYCVSASLRRSSNQIHRRAHGYDLRLPSESGKAGQLLRVKLYNFMCHENFEIYFGNHVNFVFGKNGSGKSAILQAIQLCCGSTAKGTGRGTNLSNFVKTGSTSGKIMVSLWNTGSEAYRRSIFGNVITVERTISKRSTYAFINEHGQTIHCKKHEVDALFGHFRIVCSNPSVILTQGAASSFLRGKHLPADLYSLYMKVTEFEATVEKHNDAYKSLEASKALVAEEKERIEEMKSVKQNLTERTERAREQQTASVRLEHFQNIVPHLEAKEYAQKLVHQKRLIQQQEEALASQIEDMHGKQEEVNRVVQVKESFNEEHQSEDVRSLIHMLGHEKTELAIQKRSLERECKEPKARILVRESEIDETKRDIELRKRKVETLKNDDGDETRAVKEAFDQEIAHEQENIEKHQAELTAATDSLHELQTVISTKEQQQKRISDHSKQIQAEIRRLNEDMERLQHEQNDPLKRFGGDPVKRLRAEIDRHQNRFYRAPIGPLGSYLSVKDDLWSIAIEFAIGWLFDSFIVHSLTDERTLRALCRRTHRDANISIIVYSFDHEPYQLNKYDNLPHLTIKKILQIANFDGKHTLSNILVDYGSIERTGLCSSEAEAFAIINNHTCHTGRVWLPTGRKVYKSRHGEVSMHDGRRLQPRLVKDTSRLYERNQQELRQNKSALRDLNHEQMDVEAELRTLFEQRRELNITVRQLSVVHQKYQDDLQELKDRGPELPASAAYDINRIQQELRDLNHRMVLKQREVKDAETMLEEKGNEIKRIEQTLSEKREILEQKRKDIGRVQSEVAKINSELSQAESNLHRSQTQLEAKTSKKEELESALEILEERKAELDEKACEQCNGDVFQESFKYLQEYCAEIGAPESELSCSKAKKQIIVLKRLVRNLSVNGTESYEDLLAEREELEAKLMSQIVLVSDQEKAITESEAGFRQREDLYKKQQQSMDKSINNHFKRYMKKRGHSGRINFDHRSKLVQILVKMIGQEEMAKDLASLSGGERSYTTIALLLAFASIVDSPFHCMDEFDVFTDALTKHYSMMALLETAATEKFTSQFVFFSPQDVAAVEDAKRAVNQQYYQKTGENLIPDKFLMIYTMAPPRR